MSQYFSRRPWREYGLLPTSDPQSPLSLHSSSFSKASEKRRHTNHAVLPSRFRLPKRYTRLILASLVSSGVLCFLNIDWFSRTTHHPQHSDPLIPYPPVQETPPEESTLPPLYEAYREYEDQLSQQYLLNQTASDRYIFFAISAHGSGWGNVLQEMLFNALLAEKANLGYVWKDYTWDTSGMEYCEFQGRKIVSRIPISTMLGGHILGLGSRNESAVTQPPRPISSRVYDKLCPQSERVFIDRELVKVHLRSMNSPINIDEALGTEVLKAWLLLLDTPKYKNARCIEVKKNSEHVFDIWLFGSSRIQSLWDTLSRSLVFTNWGWSPLTYRSFTKNVRFFAAEQDLHSHSHAFLRGLWDFFSGSGSGSTPRPSRPSAAEVDNTSSHMSMPAPDLTISKINPRVFDDSAPLPVLVLHLRRADFEEHCKHLAEWSSTYTGFNSFPASRVRDGFDVPRIIGPDTDDSGRQGDPLEVFSMDEKKQVYVKHCFPDTKQVVKRVREVVTDYESFAVEREERKGKGKKGFSFARWWSWDGDGGYVEGDDVDGKVHRRGGLIERRSKGKGSVANNALKKIYIMTNGNPAWLAEVKQALMEDAASAQGQGHDTFEWVWEGISTSRDLKLGWEEKPVSQALDMYVAQRAEVFVGNGFSSLTSNIVMLRMKMGFDPVQTRFW